MPVIWGLDLKEIQWGKFKSSNMWNNVYHLRRTKFIIYQAAMILCVISESLGTAVLSDYTSQQRYIEGHSDHAASIYNDDYVGIASFNIFVGIYVATIFGGAFFFDLFWPERYESPAVRLAWKICSVLTILFVLADAIPYTLIVATRREHFIGGNDAETAALMQEFGPTGASGSPLKYKTSTRAFASIILLWLGWPCCIASTIILWKSQMHDEKLGPKSTHARQDEEAVTGSPGSHEPKAAETEEYAPAVHSQV